MVYRVTVDGKRTYAETALTDYSTEKDRLSRERICTYFREELGAKEVIFDTSFEETARLHEMAGEFYENIMELFGVINAFPESSWGPDEMGQLIPLLMRIYILAMRFPELEYMEDSDYEWKHDYITRKIAFSEEYEYYWMVFDPYSPKDLYKEDPAGPEGELCKGALWDDLGDILSTLEDGADAYEAGLVCEAIFNWRFGLCIHYGRHITNALSAKCRVWEDSCEDNKKFKEPNDYWAYDTDSVIVK